MEITNKTLALLLVSAVAISLFGTILSINKLNQFQTLKGTTGYALTDTGVASVVVNSTTSIRFSVSTINWGSGYVNTSGSFVNCTMATDAAHSEGCYGFENVTQGFVIENDGSTNITVQLLSNATAAQFIGGSSGGGPIFEYKVSDNETNSCTGETPTTYTVVNTTGPVGTTICPSSGLDFNNSKDSMEIDIRINIPDNAPSGAKYATLTASAS